MSDHGDSLAISGGVAVGRASTGRLCVAPGELDIIRNEFSVCRVMEETVSSVCAELCCGEWCVV